MGKKSKRKNNNKPPCYHGCTKKEFQNCGDYYQILESYDRDNYTHEQRTKFRETHKRYMLDAIFGNFVIARTTNDYLKGKIYTVLLVERLFLLLDIRYMFIPNDAGEEMGPESENMKTYNKYLRDVRTERGRINCMAREIPCDCMEEKRLAAKSMDKVAMCYYCWEEFSKKDMLRCTGCDLEQYCSTACSIQAWPKHKVYCPKNGR